MASLRCFVLTHAGDHLGHLINHLNVGSFSVTLEHCPAAVLWLHAGGRLEQRCAGGNKLTRISKARRPQLTHGSAVGVDRAVLANRNAALCWAES